MREPPGDLTDDDVLALVRRHWSREVDRVEHLPVGSGAHHWQALSGFRPMLFVTVDTLPPAGAGLSLPRHTAASLEASYAAAAELAFGLDLVVAGLPGAHLDYTVRAGAGRLLSVTPWVQGETVAVADDETTTRLLARLHAAHPPRGLPAWESVVRPDLAERLADLLDRTWDTGPHAGPAQAALRAHLPDVERWTSTHRSLLERTRDRPRVVTHGSPHAGHQLVTAVRTLLVGWESVRLAPRERDLADGRRDGTEPDPEVLEVLDLERRLDEIARHAGWFAAPDTGGADDAADDAIALGGLLHQLARP